MIKTIVFYTLSIYQTPDLKPLYTLDMPNEKTCIEQTLTNKNLVEIDTYATCQIVTCTVPSFICSKEQIAEGP